MKMKRVIATFVAKIENGLVSRVKPVRNVTEGLRLVEAYESLNQPGYFVYSEYVIVPAVEEGSGSI